MADEYDAVWHEPCHHEGCPLCHNRGWIKSKREKPEVAEARCHCGRTIRVEVGYGEVTVTVLKKGSE